MTDAERLAEFVLAQIADDEAAARAATRNEWSVDTWRNDKGVEFLIVPDIDLSAPAFGIKNEADAVHIARHDPARVLAECAAKRKIVELYQVAATHDDSSLGVATLRVVIRELAQPYADRPGFDPTWKVET